ncbi:hypothetical protein D3C72_2386080 [compost metagenome]
MVVTHGQPDLRNVRTVQLLLGDDINDRLHMTVRSTHRRPTFVQRAGAQIIDAELMQDLRSIVTTVEIGIEEPVFTFEQADNARHAFFRQ